MHSRILMIATIIASLATSDIWALSETSGTPLGGIGSGYVKYNARTGEIAASDRTPPAAGSMAYEFSSKKSSSSGFHFFAGGESVQKAKTENEDAKCPLYRADFGKTNNIQFSLNAFGPVVPGAGELNIQLATSPAALFEITAKNTGSSAIDIAVAFEFLNRSSQRSGLLGGKDEAEIDAELSNRGMFFPTAEFSDLSNDNTAKNTGNAYMLAECSKDGAEFSAGKLGNFLTTGILSSGNGNSIAAKCNIGAGETVTFKFVLAWWRTFISSQARYVPGHNDEDNFFYHNYYGDSKEAAVFCMEHFDYVRNGIVSMVDRVMKSSFPEWYKDRLLNNTYPLIHNSLWTKDGRAAYWEGKYGILGTIDQGQHAAIWYVHNWPKNQWAELAYWLRDARQEPEYLGQIHHDFNISPNEGFTPPESRFMTPWDHWDRDDYWFQPTETKEWSDLNSMAIFKAYELMTVTGDRDSLDKYFDYVKTTAGRLFQMAQNSSSYIPLDSRSTYDSKGEITPQYACGVAVAAYKAMIEMAKFLGDTETEQKYQEIYDKAREEYKEKVFDSQYGALTTKGWAEGHVGGYSWANYFCFPPIQDQDFIEAGCTRAYNIYSSHSDLKEKVGGWHYYTYDHLGGALTAIGEPDKAWQIHKWDHELYYINLPGLVFWQELFSNAVGPSNYASYMTGPNIWRSYFQFMGYLLDKANNRLWIRPNLPSEMENKLTDAALPNPYGWGTLRYDGSDNLNREKQTQEIFITYDNATTVKEIVLKNNTGTNTPFVILTSQNYGRIEDITTVAEDWGIEQNIRVTLSSPIDIDNKGLRIRVFSEEVGTINGLNRTPRSALKIASSSLSACKPIICSIDKPGNIKIDLLSLNGKKIGTLVDRNVTTVGKHTFFWNGKTIGGKTVGSVVGILRLTSSGGTVSRLVFNMER